MASFYHDNRDDHKASSLANRTSAHGLGAPDSSAGGDTRGRRSTDARGIDRRSRRLWVSILVDIILLLLLAGLLVGGWFGYRALREWYAPTWETRDVVYCVEMQGIDPDLVKYGQDGRPTLTNNAIWSSDRTDADHLGTVTDVRTVLVAWEDGRNTLTLYLTVEATAYYREGKGYRMGETMLLAGSEGTYRVEGMIADGRIISMHEVQDESDGSGDTEAGTVWVNPEEHSPEAINPDAEG